MGQEKGAFTKWRGWHERFVSGNFRTPRAQQFGCWRTGCSSSTPAPTSSSSQKYGTWSLVCSRLLEKRSIALSWPQILRNAMDGITDDRMLLLVYSLPRKLKHLRKRPPSRSVLKSLRESSSGVSLTSTPPSTTPSFTSPIFPERRPSLVSPVRDIFSLTT